MSQILHVFTDGASRGNPGPSGIGVFAYVDTPEHLIFSYGYSFYKTTNNVAEYAACVLALHTLANLKWEGPIALHADSLLLVKQMNREYRVKEPHLAQWYMLAAKLRQHVPCTISHVRREHNREADALANKGIDEKILPTPEFEQLWRTAIPKMYWPSISSHQTLIQKSIV